MESPPVSDEKFLKYWNTVKENPSDFTSWTCLLQTVDQENLVEKGREAYEEFFKLYPYCYGYWKKYADLEKKNGNIELTKKVFQSGISAIPLSIDLWMHYLNFMTEIAKEETDDPNLMPNLFTEAIKAAGLEFRSDKLYDAYLDWERLQGNLKNITTIYDQILSTPTQQYSKHFAKFKEHVNSNKPADILAPEEYLKFLGELESIPPGVSIADDADAAMPTTAPPGVDDDGDGKPALPPGDSDMDNNDDQNDNKNAVAAASDEMSAAKKENNEEEEIKKKIIASREIIFKKNDKEVEKRWNFEDAIKRPYFHVKPLERSQLRNWREYLDFEINEGNHERICILFERSLIACALYEEFWQKYISYLESQTDIKDGIEEVRSVYERACKIHLTKKPNIILNWAAFEEKNNVEKAREILKSLDENVPGVVMVKLRRAGLERRHGDPGKAVEILKNEIEKAVSVDEKSFFAIKCSKLFSKFLNDEESAKEIIYQALENDKSNKKLYLHLLDLELSCKELNEGRIEELCNLVLNCEQLTSEFKQGFFQRRLEILEDLGSSISSIMEAYEAYQKQFKVLPGTVAAKKRAREESDEELKTKVSKADSFAQSNNANMNSYYSNSTYPASGTSSVAMAATSGYGYTPAVTNQWGQYAAQNASAYYGWYNPYGAYPQQPTQ